MEEDKSPSFLDTGEKALKIALKLGVDEAEAFLTSSTVVLVRVERGKIVQSSKHVDEGLGVRIVCNASLGFSYTNILNEESLEKNINKALHVAKSNKPDKNWPSFPTPNKLQTTKDTYDTRITRLSLEEAVDMTSRMLESALNFDKRVVPVEGSVTKSEVLKVVVNSCGVKFKDEGTYIHCSLGTIAKDGVNVTPTCFEYDDARTLNINPERVGLEAAKYAVSALNAKKIETGGYDIILAQQALAGLFYYTLVNALKGDHVQRGMSMLKGKVGEKIASELFTAYDDGLLEGGISTWKFDDEGTPSQKTVLIEKGVLKGFIYDRYTARKEGFESTGNARRTLITPYASTPKIETTNFTVLQRDKTPEQLLNEMDKGIFIHYVQGAHSSNPETGEFSVVATPAWIVEGGEPSHALKGIMLTGTIYETLQKISGIANNVRKTYFLAAPWIKVDKVRIIGM